MNVTLEQSDAISSKLSQLMFDFQHDPNLPRLGADGPSATQLPLTDSQDTRAQPAQEPLGEQIAEAPPPLTYIVLGMS